MATYQEWLVELQATQRGRIWQANFQFDQTRINLVPEVIGKFVDAVERALASPTPPLHALDVIRSAILSDQEAFDLQGQRQPPAPYPPFSLVVKVEVFAEKYLSPRAMAGRELDDRSPGDYVWRELGRRILPAFYDKEVRTARRFFWGTPTASLEELKRQPMLGNLADVMRDQLGLEHFKRGDRLLQIDVPSGKLDGKRVCAPTTLDAELHPPFVTWDDPTGYGWTLNLGTFERGLEEVVVEGLLFTPEFTVHKIGQVDADAQVDWNTVEQFLSSRI